MAKKRFRVEIAEAAKQDVVSSQDYIALDKPKAAAKWARSMYAQMRSLRYFPMRNELIPEAEEIQRSYRHIIWGNYRIIYAVDENVVTIVRVIHASRLLNPRHFRNE